MVKVGRIYLLSIRTRPTVPQYRSEAAQGGAGRARRILVLFNRTRKGKGIRLVL